jgi:hypothetical protein
VTDAEIDALTLGERLARAVLLFHEAGPWDGRKARLWRALTGGDEATTKTLGELARRVLAQRGKQ